MGERLVKLDKETFVKMVKRDLHLETRAEKMERIKKLKHKENKVKADYLSYLMFVKERNRRRINRKNR